MDMDAASLSQLPIFLANIQVNFSKTIAKMRILIYNNIVCFPGNSR